MFKQEYLDLAIEQARKSLKEGGIPIGCVIMYCDAVLGRGHNQRVQKGSVILHGEMDAFENAGRQPSSIYEQCELYTTLSPCSMCTGTILLYGIKKVYIGENKTFKGAEELLLNNGVEVKVVNDDECIQLMKEFINNNPRLWDEDIGK